MASSLCEEPNTFVLCPPQLAKDLVHPSAEDERRKHKKKRLVQSPNSYFMDVKCPGKSLNYILQKGSELILYTRHLH